MTNIIKDQAMILETIMNQIDGFDYIPEEEFEKHDETLKKIREITKEEKKESKILNDIDKRLDKLDEDIDMYDSVDSKAERYIEKRKAIHEIKKIIQDADKYDALDE